jgi:hypothetical protein
MRDIPVVQRIRTGWAAKAANRNIQRKLVEMGKEISIKTGALEVCKPEVWSIYAVPNVPYQQHDLTGNTYTADKCIAQEVAIETGVEPVLCEISKKGIDRATNTATWIIAFKRPVRTFRLFGSSAPSKEVRKTPHINLHNPGCQGYCVQARCNRELRCKNCGQTLKDHPEGGGCTNPTKCVNCAGPFQAGHEGCPAAPKLENGVLRRPTKSQLHKIRRHGRQQFTASIMPMPPAEESPEQEGNATPALNTSRHAPGLSTQEDEGEFQSLIDPASAPRHPAWGEGPIRVGGEEVDADADEEMTEARETERASTEEVPAEGADNIGTSQARRSNRIEKRSKSTKTAALGEMLGNLGRKTLIARQATTPPSN